MTVIKNKYAPNTAKVKRNRIRILKAEIIRLQYKLKQLVK